ncbi:MAG: DUF4238 domain-containing protein [Gammaproteobacteria bacterium WSBS_2016_MAG_OTU1]
MTARHHHFLSQCYLKGFTCGQSKKSKLAVIDIKRNTSFETIPRNVGGVRDFNRIDIKGINPNCLEHELSKFENQVATALKNLRKTLNFSGETKGIILNFIALTAGRSPERREQMRQIDAKIAESKALGFKEMRESQIYNLKKNDKLKENISDEDAKNFVDPNKYTTEVPREHPILSEMILSESILHSLFHRQWLLVIANKKSGPFITTDSPVNLLWKDSEKIPPFLRDSPGFGLQKTRVYFPISQELALIGEFDGNETKVNAAEDLVAKFNSMMICNCHTQIYAPKLDFKFWNKENNILRVMIYSNTDQPSKLLILTCYTHINF